MLAQAMVLFSQCAIYSCVSRGRSPGWGHKVVLGLLPSKASRISVQCKDAGGFCSSNFSDEPPDVLSTVPCSSKYPANRSYYSPPTPPSTCPDPAHFYGGEEEAKVLQRKGKRWRGGVVLIQKK